MGRPKVTMKLEGVEALRRRIHNPSFVLEPIQQMLTEGAEIGQKAAVIAIDGGEGKAVRTIMTSIKSPGSARVYTLLPTVKSRSIDRGRRRGERVSIRALERWKRVTGHPSTVRNIRDAIERSGTPGKQFMSAGRQAVEAAMPKLIDQLGTKMERWFNRP